MLPSMQQAARVMLLAVLSPTVSMREFGPVLIPPQQVSTMMGPGGPLVPCTPLKSWPLISIGPSTLMRSSPLGWLIGWMKIAPPRSTVRQQLERISMPGAFRLLPLAGTPTVVMTPPGATRSFLSPRSKIAFQVCTAEVGLTKLKVEALHRASDPAVCGLPLQVGGFTLKLTLTIVSMRTSVGLLRSHAGQRWTTEMSLRLLLSAI